MQQQAGGQLVVVVVCKGVTAMANIHASLVWWVMLAGMGGAVKLAV